MESGGRSEGGHPQPCRVDETVNVLLWRQGLSVDRRWEFVRWITLRSSTLQEANVALRIEHWQALGISLGG
jgi:hypothetical protein